MMTDMMQPSNPSAEYAIQVENLGKMYNLYASPQDRLKHMLLWRFGKTYGHSFWALDGVSFSIKRGETFGVIGKNGSGKSTLLQILAGILPATNGSVQVHGRVAALLELGSGFNPEFTGRENIFLNGSILGISRAEMAKRVDEIIAFADIDEFIDQPVKLYSSGMFVRLAFSIATSVDAEILLVDEALAVGDIFFRQKCYRRLDKLKENGASIILVSHSMNEVEQFCQRALLLSHGKMEFLGPAVDAVKKYYIIDQTEKLSAIKQTQPDVSEVNGWPDAGPEAAQVKIPDWPHDAYFIDLQDRTQVTQGMARCNRFTICNTESEPCSAFQQGEKAIFFYEFEVLEDIQVPSGGIEIINDKGTIVHGKNSLLVESGDIVSVPKGSLLRFRQEIQLSVAVGEYSFNIGLATLTLADYEIRSEMSNSDLDSKTVVLCIVPGAGKFAVLYRMHGVPAQLSHYGISDLPGSIDVARILPEPGPRPVDERR